MHGRWKLHYALCGTSTNLKLLKERNLEKPVMFGKEQLKKNKKFFLKR